MTDLLLAAKEKARKQELESKYKTSKHWPGQNAALLVHKAEPHGAYFTRSRCAHWTRICHIRIAIYATLYVLYTIWIIGSTFYVRRQPRCWANVRLGLLSRSSDIRFTWIAAPMISVLRFTLFLSPFVQVDWFKSRQIISR